VKRIPAKILRVILLFGFLLLPVVLYVSRKQIDPHRYAG